MDPLMLQLVHDRDNRFYYFKHLVRVIKSINEKTDKHTEADPPENTILIKKEGKLLKFYWKKKIRKQFFQSTIDLPLIPTPVSIFKPFVEYKVFVQ